MIYFIQDDSTLAIKIGFTDGEAAARLKALQTGCPGGLVLLLTIPGDARTETEWHARHKAARERGEWFRPTPDLIREILDVAMRAARPKPATRRQCRCGGLLTSCNNRGGKFGLMCESLDLSHSETRCDCESCDQELDYESNPADEIVFA